MQSLHGKASIGRGRVGLQQISQTPSLVEQLGHLLVRNLFIFAHGDLIAVLEVSLFFSKGYLRRLAGLLPALRDRLVLLGIVLLQIIQPGLRSPRRP